MAKGGLERPARGFTLIELMVVITIIGILGTLVAMRVAAHLSHARAVKADHDLRQIVEAARTIEIATGALPQSLEELVRPVDARGRAVPGGLDALPLDSWNRPYGYAVHSGEPVAFTLGKDGLEGGEGDDADVQVPTPAR